MLEDFKAIQSIIRSLEGSAGAGGQKVLEDLSSGIGLTINRISEMDLSMLDDVTIRQALAEPL